MRRAGFFIFTRRDTSYPTPAGTTSNGAEPFTALHYPNYVKFSSAFVLLALAFTSLRAAPDTLRFFFGTAPAPAGATVVGSAAVFANGSAFGFDEGAVLSAGARGVTSNRAFSFSARVPTEGNYRVTVTVGDTKAASVTTIKAELRRPMAEISGHKLHREHAHAFHPRAR